MVLAAARSEEMVCVQNKLCMARIGENDQPVWSISKKGTYTCSDAWNWQHMPTVDWWNIVWYSLAIPKHSFVL
jgi:hypothetical protein